MGYIKTNAGFIPTARVLRDNTFKRLEIRREAQRNFAADKFFFWVLVVCLVIVVAQIFLILVSWRKLPPQVPLFYSYPWGETVLARPFELWILPIATIFFTVLNFFLAVAIFGENRFLHRILVVASLIVAVASFYDLVRIISLIV